MERIKYITNKELLIEIDRSKRTYSYFTKPQYARFDAIVHDVSAITPELIATTLTKRLELVAKQGPAVWGDALANGITEEDIVFRVMTNEHIPLDPNRKRRSKLSTDEGQAKTPFPPYKHYIYVNGKTQEVGRSHWKGDLVTGQFCIEHGKITNRLATMFMLLVERYSKRGNWRGYCVDETTEALTQRGWLGINEINENDIILSYNEGQLAWSNIKSIFRDDFDGKMFNLTVTGMDALVTPGHKFITDKGLKPVEYLLEKDKLILTGSPVADGAVTYSDAFVELVGWFVTEGNCYDETCRNYTRVTLYQNEGPYADRIRACLSKMNVKYGEGTKVNPSGLTNVVFSLQKETCQQLLEVATDKILSMPFLLSLSQAQREILIDTMIDADGWRTKSLRRYCQKDKKHVDAFVALCAMAGLRLAVKHKAIVSYKKPTEIYTVNLFTKRRNVCMVENVDFHGGKSNSGEFVGKGKFHHPNEATIDYQGKVWCPETEFGSFMARRNGYIYLSGNTYVDEMRNHALLQLSQVGLQFDECKSDNPFAFYTQIIKNSYTRVLNIERKNQHIRDDLLIIAGVQPSYTRQIDHEIEQRFNDDHATNHPNSEPAPSKVVELPKKRGRKPKATPKQETSSENE